jgi:nucleotide-binding universal stress UspA family protein
MTAATAAVVPIIPAIQLKRILYATDFSEGSQAALPIVSAIARHYHSEVFVSHIWSPAPCPIVTPETLAAQYDQEWAATQKVAAIMDITTAQGIVSKSIVRPGNPAEELEQIVREEEIDLAVLSTHGRVGMKHLMMGSVAEAFFPNVPCPVLTFGPHLQSRFQNMTEIHNILFPTDLSTLSQAVFPYLTSLAHEFDARITILYVLPPETENNPEAIDLAEPLRQQTIRTFGPQISPRCDSDFVIDAGYTAEKILAQAAKRHADVIGFGVRKAGEITTHFRNTVAYRVLLKATCPVLTCCSHR